jgi:hypothetical protein
MNIFFVNAFILYRKCKMGKNNPAKCKGLSIDVDKCELQECPCVLNAATLKEATGKETLEGAWIEKDGLRGQTPGDKALTAGDEIQEGVKIHMNCRNW